MIKSTFSVSYREKEEILKVQLRCMKDSKMVVLNVEGGVEEW
jgi:hypothetical protein